MLQIVCARCSMAAMAAAQLRRLHADTAGDAKQLGDLFCVVGKSGRDGGEFGRMYLVTRALGAAIDEAVKKNDAIAAGQARREAAARRRHAVPVLSRRRAGLPGRKICRGRRQANRRDRVHLSRHARRQLDDRLVLVNEDGRLQIDDVLLRHRNTGDGLRKALVELFRQLKRR